MLPAITLLLSFLGSVVGQQPRYEDQPFSSDIPLLGRTVTCGKHVPGKFPSRTWSCHDLKVDGDRLILTYFPGTGGSTKDCGEDVGRNDIAELCRHLLRSHGIKYQLWTAYASSASCGKSEGNRVYFTKVNATGPPRYEWSNEYRGKGYIISLQCMVMD